MRNVEAKFRLRDRDRMRERALALGFVEKATFAQRDTFFRVASGKLKLREEQTGACLIYYRRDGSAGSQLSDYEIIPVAEPERVRMILCEGLGILAEVRKDRTLLLLGNIRLHLDRVEGLGEFGEFEAVVSDTDAVESMRHRVTRLLADLGVARDDLVEASYFELATR
jgi:predicted adenylyl cyclase CyaB